MRRAGLFAAAAFTLIAGHALAADLPRKAPAPPPPPPPFSWTGFYIGIHGGSAWGTTESTINSISDPAGFLGGGIINLGIPFSSHGTNGWLFGGQIGYNWQVNPWLVIGVEGEGAWNNLEGTTPCLVIVACRTELNWTAAASARVGFAVDRALIYVKGGAVWGNFDHTATANLSGLGGPVLATSVSDTRIGALFGAGVEYAFLPNWSAKIEYNFMDFGNNDQTFDLVIPPTLGGPATLGVNTTINNQIHVIKAGVNYRFGGWGG